MNLPGEKEETTSVDPSPKEKAGGEGDHKPAVEPVPDDKLIGDDFLAERAGTVDDEEGTTPQQGPSNY